jgi:ketosteroid isomerase-like protein
MSPRDVVGQLLSVRRDSRRTFAIRLALRFPRLAARGNQLLLRLPRTSRIRRALLWRVVQQGWELFNATHQVNIHMFASDVVIVEPDDVLGHEDAPGQVHRGRGAAVHSVRKLTDTWEDFRIEPEQLFDLGDQMVLFVRWRGRGRASGIPLDQPLAYVGTFRGGQIARNEVYVNRDEALRSVGLRE